MTDPSTDPDDPIRRFLASPSFAVVGAGNRMHKYGARVFAAYLAHGRRAFPVNPRETIVQGRPCFASLAQLPEKVEAVSVITPPEVTERIVEEAAAAGAKRIWMQPGAESRRAVARARELGLEVIANGPCVLVELGAE
jgi:predicted CoA-binding protein